MNKNILILTLLTLFTLFIWFCYYKLSGPANLTFSDAAKFADIARTINEKGIFASSFVFYPNINSYNPKTGFFLASEIPPLMPYAVSFAFKIWGVSDLSVQLTSGVFFLITALFTYLLGKKFFGNTVGLLSALAVISHPNILQYGVSGASESAFISEIISSVYFLTNRKKLFQAIGLIVLLMMYYTRLLAPLYIFPILVYAFFVNYRIYLKSIKNKTWVILTVLFIVLLFIFRKYLSFKINAFLSVSMVGTSLIQGNSYLRNTYLPDLDLSALILVTKKLFYNLYNFYKLLPQIISPYLFTVFVLSAFIKYKHFETKCFKFLTYGLMFLVLVTSAILIPDYRYLHPVVPFICIVGIATLVSLINNLVKNRAKVIMASLLLIIFFSVGQTLGLIFLDSRFQAKQINHSLPSTYVGLSRYLKQHTSETDIILTNLDTWGSWYGQRKTVWFPLTPDQLLNSKVQIDAIYLTSYLMDDENYYMGSDWRQIFQFPNQPENTYIRDHFVVKSIFIIPADDVYEKYEAKAVLLVRKDRKI